MLISTVILVNDWDYDDDHDSAFDQSTARYTLKIKPDKTGAGTLNNQMK